jgi:hypothetical protein
MWPHNGMLQSRLSSLGISAFLSLALPTGDVAVAQRAQESNYSTELER